MIAFRLIGSRGAILGFHGVTSARLTSCSDVHLPLERLAALISAVRDVGRIVPLRELVARDRAGRSTAGLTAITADDAYVSWLSEAGEYVRREDLPLTVFAVAGAADRGASYWWDRIDDVFPRVSRERWRAFEDACGLTADYRAGQPTRYGPLRPLRQWLLASHTGRWPVVLESGLRALEEESGACTRQRSMTFDELSRFAALPSVEIGIHTVSHPVLPLLSDAEMEQEISGCYRALRERFDDVVPILAVPFGLFDGRTVSAARAAGMTASLTLAGATLKRHAGREDLPRFCMSRDESTWKLKLRLLDALDWLRPRRSRVVPPYPELPSPTT